MGRRIMYTYKREDTTTESGGLVSILEWSDRRLAVHTEPGDKAIHESMIQSEIKKCDDKRAASTGKFCIGNCPCHCLTIPPDK